MSRPFGRASRCMVRRNKERTTKRGPCQSISLPPLGHVPEVKYFLGGCGCLNRSALNRKSGRFDVQEEMSATVADDISRR